jgi:hypothetical protein
VNQRNSGLFLSQRVISSIAQEDLNWVKLVVIGP